MTLGEKLAKLRKENNYTQEQFAELLDVSRQSVSKWESDISYPETEKLIKIGKLYGCSMDYLLMDEIQEKDGQPPTLSINLTSIYYERKSKKTVCGMPLWHVNIGYGRTAKGIIAVGLKARGIVSVGLTSLGIVSVGVLPLGVLSLGALAFGLIALGGIAVGVIALGAIGVGILAIGAMAIGLFSAGALAIGYYLAIGDAARGTIAVGITEAIGTLYQTTIPLTEADRQGISAMLNEQVPWILSWAKAMICLFL